MRLMLMILAAMLIVASPWLVAPSPQTTGPLSGVLTLCLLGYASSLMIKCSWAGGSSEFTISETADGEDVRQWVVADSQTDQLCNIAIDVDKVVLFFIVSTQDVTVEANDGSSPDFTLSLKANEPYVWHSSALDSFLCTADVTKFYVTNASGASATVTCYVLQDTTP